MFVAGPVAERIGIANLYYASAAILIGTGLFGMFKLPGAGRAQPEKQESASSSL
jgi:hypothetical protein